MKKLSFLFLFSFIYFQFNNIFGVEKELRGVWLTKTASQVLASKQNIAAAMDSLKRTGLNAVYPNMFKDGHTLYPSDIMEELTGYRVDPFFGGRDLLAEIIAEAHRLGMEVHPWIEFGFVAGHYRKGPILENRPDWAGRRLSTGEEVSDDGFHWMSQANEEVRQFLIRIALEMVDHYDIDGLMFDRVRYGNVKHPSTGELVTSDFGYDDAHVQRYRLEHNGQDPPSVPTNASWMKWRSTMLDEFSRMLYDSVKAHNADIMVASTPVIYPYGYTLFLQNWPVWVRNNDVDYIVPQVYRYTLSAYSFEVVKIINQQVAAGYQRFYPGMLIRDGDYQAPGDLAAGFVSENRKRLLQGGIFWFYEGIPAIAEHLRTTLFQEQAAMPYRDADWRTPAIIVEEDDSLVQRTGTWTEVTGKGADGYFSYDGHALRATGGTGARVIYTAEIAMPGHYDVYVHQPYGAQLAANVPVRLLFDDEVAITIDETDAIFRGWIHVGAGEFAAGAAGILEIGTDQVSGSKAVVADAVMLILNRRLTKTFVPVERQDDKLLPITLKLWQNYPNPFNPTTIISYELSQSQYVRLEIFDLLGRRVALLAEGVQSVGLHRLRFDARDLSNGVYFCGIAGERSGFKMVKMMLLR